MFFSKALCLAVVGAASGAALGAGSAHKPIDARNVFVPIGFDDNDESVVVLDGYLPSGCYKMAPPQVKVDQAEGVVTIHPMAHYFDHPCIEALVPYHQEVRLGVLPKGRYRIEAVGATRTLQEALNVAEANNAGPDDFLYAPIDDVTVAQESPGGKVVATIEGRFTDTCMQIEELRVVDNGKTVNLLPILTHAGTDCRAQEVTFTRTVELPDSVAVGRHLLHVRSLNGQAVNALFYKNAH